jgi:hypothetical protein
MEGKKYQIIYADPPWQYDFSKDNADKIENHYPTMTLKDICVLNVPSDDNCVLYLWATAPKLLEALEVMKSWIKNGFEWDIGLGEHTNYYLSAQRVKLVRPNQQKESRVFTKKKEQGIVKSRDILEILLLIVFHLNGIN